MKGIKRELMKLVGRVVETEADIDVYSWPPHCAGIFHQPRRPQIENGAKILREKHKK